MTTLGLALSTPSSRTLEGFHVVCVCAWGGGNISSFSNRSFAHRAEYVAITDSQALAALQQISCLEGWALSSLVLSSQNTSTSPHLHTHALNLTSPSHTHAPNLTLPSPPCFPITRYHPCPRDIPRNCTSLCYCTLSALLPPRSGLRFWAGRQGHGDRG